ncbi:hypothetical protein MASR2M78_05070 [Treponema sp.]
MNKVIFINLLVSLLFLVSCFQSKEDKQKLPAQGAPSNTELQEIEGEANPLTFSFSEPLSQAALVKVSQYHPDYPFPEAVYLSASNLELLYGGQRVPILEGGETEEDELRYDLGSKESYKTARRGEIIYERKAHFLVQYLQDADTGDTTELNRYASKATLVAGPVAFQDALLLATDTPSFIILDRKSLSLLFEREIDSLLSDPLIPLFSQQLLFAHRSDGDMAFYSLKDRTSLQKGIAQDEDPVESLLRGNTDAFLLIRQRCAQLLGEAELESFQFKAIHPYLPRTELEAEGPVLFRLDADSNGTMKYFVQGSDRPYLIAVFDSKGHEIISNIDYSVSPLITAALNKGSTYFIATALLGRADENASTPRLVIAAK